MSTSFSTTAYALQFDPYGASTLTAGDTTNGGYTQNPYTYAGGDPINRFDPSGRDSTMGVLLHMLA